MPSVSPLFSNWNLSKDFQMSSARAFKHNIKWNLLGLEESAFIITKNSRVSRVNLTSDLSVSLIHYAIIITRVILIFLCNFSRISKVHLTWYHIRSSYYLGLKTLDLIQLTFQFQ